MTYHVHSYRKPKLPIDMEYALSSTGNGDGAHNDVKSDGDVHTGDGDGAHKLPQSIIEVFAFAP